MSKLNDLLNQLEHKIQYWETKNTQVSKATIGWHIEHSLLVINAVLLALQKSRPEHYIWSFNLNRFLILTFKKIPKGKAKAPKVVQPKENFDESTLRAHLAQTLNNIAILNQTLAEQYFPHPLLGDLKRDQTEKFLRIHTQHHLDIINLILT